MSHKKDTLNFEALFNTIFLFLSKLIAFTLPFSIQVNSILIALLIVTWIIQGLINKNILTPFKSKKVLLFTSIFFLYLIGITYSENFSEALFSVEKKLSLLIFPVIFFSIKPDSIYKGKVLKSFVCACALASIICIIFATYRSFYLETPNLSSNWDILSKNEYFNLNKSEVGILNYYSYTDFTSILGIHPTYFGLYLAFCSFIIFFSINIKKKKFYSLFQIILLILFISLIILLASRIILLTFISTSSIYLIIYFYRKKLILKGLIFLFCLNLSFSVLIFLSPVTKYRLIQQLKSTNLSFPKDHNLWNSTNLRLAYWHCSFNIFKENFIFGIGPGDISERLYSCYKQLDFGPFLKKYNAHNQYLETSAALGIIGLLSLLLPLGYGLISSYREKNNYYLIFLFLFCICSLTESTFGLQKGVVFYGFFNSLFAFLIKSPLKLTHKYS